MFANVGINGGDRFWRTSAVLGAPFVWSVFYLLADSFSFQAPVQPSNWVVLVFLVPVLEEWVFRGWLFTRLHQAFATKLTIKFINQTLSVSIANAISSVLFCVLHLFSRDAITAVVVFVPSIVLGGIREETNRVLPCMVTHVAWNMGFYLVLGLR